MEYVQKSYIKAGVDVAKSLKKMEWLDLDAEEPVMETTKKEMNKGGAEEQEIMKLKWQEQYARHLDRVKEYKLAMCRAFAMIRSQHCSKTMQTRVEEHPDYETKIDDDPIALLEAIKTLMHDPVRAQYPFASMTAQLSRFLNLKQQPDESLLDYTKRFKQQHDNAKSFLGTRFLDEFIKREISLTEIFPVGDFTN